MDEKVAPRPAYDAIAHLYDVDMARNMPFDDAGFYARICRAHGGRVLELGCGNGRILLALIAGGLDVTGVDGSAAMLAALNAKAAARGLAAGVCRMDARRLGLARVFDIVLCPYSLVTYMTGEGEPERMLAEVRSVLRPGGVVVVDAFVPRPVAAAGHFTQDYARPIGDGTLVRSKRIAALGPRINRIERRYEVQDAGGVVRELVETREEIRTFSPQDVETLLARGGWRIRETWWNYGSTAPIDGAQFFTAVAATE